MLLETLGSAWQTPLEELVETAVLAGSQGVVHKRLELRLSKKMTSSGDR